MVGEKGRFNFLSTDAQPLKDGAHQSLNPTGTNLVLNVDQLSTYIFKLDTKDPLAPMLTVAQAR